MPPERTALAALTTVMPPHDGADEQVDWDAMRRAWGVGFPSDYIAFMSTYGGGGIDDVLGILTPEASTQPPDGPGFGSMSGETAIMRQTWQFEGGPDKVDASPDSVLAWGVSCGADILGWLTTDDNPDKWPVIVWERHGWPHWRIYDCGMAEFLRRLFTKGFEECPLSVVSLWGEPSPHFIHWREEQRRRESGIDPYTGEPDPYFGMEFD
ncbi:SMI1/KNR4 family protein [Streptomyces sp. NBC_01728]|uniref:SMI1/KNR4 family protein n=1 Tax=unclassified Streptomyces TaxID=2593676 RepID=UPI00225439B0|nr:MULTISPECIES: SMI1/KNR4 family protein [unclassified Streptomyces]MCX4462469.1 SMI1/KNR4 family protein [Streptomyces sp. NBC_01719]MCX4490029.1 SMI1/KNR4 family protein [Streptomyces sp. NBC_01728]